MYKKLVPPIDENEIMSSWELCDCTRVSIVCNTFNQASYVQDAIDGFLSQVTTFKFEIIIHDDCSTDGTVEILNRYKDRYPNIIRLILQVENQFSRNISYPFKNAIQEASGFYTAICEGDDFWVDRTKLQKQYSALESNPNVYLAIHDAICVYEDGTKGDYTFKVYSEGDGVIGFENFATVPTQFAATASMFCVTSKLLDATKKLSKAPCLDIYWEMILGVNGFYYTPKSMSVYRLGAKGSYSAKHSSNMSKSLEFKRKTIAFYEGLVFEGVDKHRPALSKKLKYLKKNLAYFEARFGSLSSSELLSLYLQSFMLNNISLKQDLIIILRVLGINFSKIVGKLS